MHVITGEVSRVRRTVEAWANQNAAGTNHVITCRIDGQAVELCMVNPPQIEEGDLLTVAGDVHRGTLQARAYKNHDTGTHDRWGGSILGALVLLLVCSGFMLFAIGIMATVLGGMSGGEIPFLLVAGSALLMLCTMGARVVTAIRTSYAYHLVRSA